MGRKSEKGELKRKVNKRTSALSGAKKYLSSNNHHPSLFLKDTHTRTHTSSNHLVKASAPSFMIRELPQHNASLSSWYSSAAPARLHPWVPQHITPLPHPLTSAPASLHLPPTALTSPLLHVPFICVYDHRMCVPSRTPVGFCRFHVRNGALLRLPLSEAEYTHVGVVG